MDTIFISKFNQTQSEVILIPNRELKLENLGDLCKYCFIIGCGIKTTASLPTFILTNEGEVPLLNKFADTVYSNQLKTRYCYCIGYGNDNSIYELGQFVIFNNLCLPCHNSNNRRLSAAKTIKEVK